MTGRIRASRIVRMNAREQQQLYDAFRFVLEKHSGQRRKGTDIPYVSHLFQVAGLVQEHGGDLEQMIAALLHDTLEDCAEVTSAGLIARFDADTAQIVQDCTDTKPDEAPDQKRAWKERKIDFLQRLENVSSRSALVIACDKLHNLRSLVDDLRVSGPHYLDRFHAGPKQQIWYFDSLLERLRKHLPMRLTLTLVRSLDEFRDLTDPTR